MTSCTGPATQKILLSQVLQAVFQLRNNPFPGSSVEDVLAEYELTYPNDTDITLEEITEILNIGARRGIFTSCVYPRFSDIFYYTFNPNMVAQNPKNKEFSLPVFTNSLQSNAMG